MVVFMGLWSDRRLLWPSMVRTDVVFKRLLDVKNLSIQSHVSGIWNKFKKMYIDLMDCFESSPISLL